MSNEYNIIPYFEHIVHRISDSNWKVSLQKSIYHNFLFLIKGEGFLLHENAKIPLEPGMLCYHSPDDFFGYETSKTNFMNLFGMNFHLEKSYIKNNRWINKTEYKLPIENIMNIKNQKPLIINMQNLVDIWNEKPENYNSLLNINFQKIIHHISLENNSQVGNLKNEMAIDLTKDYIENSFTKKIKVSELAKLAGFNENYFIGLFKKHTGESIINYINKIRIIAAKEYLLKGYSVLETSHLCGFEDQFYFSKVFKKKTGISPIYFIRNPLNYF